MNDDRSSDSTYKLSDEAHEEEKYEEKKDPSDIANKGSDGNIHLKENPYKYYNQGCGANAILVVEENQTSQSEGRTQLRDANIKREDLKIDDVTIKKARNSKEDDLDKNHLSA
ncbi:hypothetical protein L6452_36101 [Arctium lappa]|uniref:Uncharacterized protein n=1 Tax=Arctium lappa TaxID=4217 RepID=A0ACB8Y8B7_ARCLA|nr:hypothetical protein L6452_36101 [Arctium lappa]